MKSFTVKDQEKFYDHEDCNPEVQEKPKNRVTSCLAKLLLANQSSCFLRRNLKNLKLGESEKDEGCQKKRQQIGVLEKWTRILHGAAPPAASIRESYGRCDHCAEESHQQGEKLRETWQKIGQEGTRCSENANRVGPGKKIEMSTTDGRKIQQNLKNVENIVR